MRKKSKKINLNVRKKDNAISETPPNPLPPSPAQVHELFKSLPEDEQDEILRMIIDDGGLQRLVSVVQDINTPGAVELMLDRVEYYHFLPVVKDPDFQ